MADGDGRFVGFTCAYAPTWLIRAAGFTPYRVLPGGDAPDQAGTVLHDNMCPHVKRILDRALCGDVPGLEGIVVVNSCDTMRRLSDAWKRARPGERVVMMDLPISDDAGAVRFLASELRRVAAVLGEWAGREVGWTDVMSGIEAHNQVAGALSALLADGNSGVKTDYAVMQGLFNVTVTRSSREALAAIRKAGETVHHSTGEGVPVYLAGNVLPDPGAFRLLAECGISVAGDDLCTGAKQLLEVDAALGDEDWTGLAQSVLQRPRCARTITPSMPGGLGEIMAEEAAGSGARGVILHVMKFCDPYLARIPGVRRAMEERGLPLLVLEGDCTLGSLGQQKTRIEAFVEMIGE